MKVSVGFNFDGGVMAWDDLAEYARAAERLGVESIWSPEGWGFDGATPLAFLAGKTSTIKLGTGITLVPERNPLLLAKEIASLDRFSGGRFLFGIGTGWLREETEIFGGDFEHRWTQTREALEVMKELWTKDEAEYHGKYYNFPPVKSYPKPAQQPHPPIIIGGLARNVLRRIVSHGDGWLPNRITPAEVEDSRKRLDAMADEAGRDPKSITISVYGQPADHDLVQSYLNAGADRVVVRPDHVANEYEMGKQLERMAEAVIR